MVWTCGLVVLTLAFISPRKSYEYESLQGEPLNSLVDELCWQ